MTAQDAEGMSTPEEEMNSLIDRINRCAIRDDAELFMAIQRLAGAGSVAKVWHRYFAGDFMAEVKVMRDGAKRWRRLTATGEGLEPALANLVTVVADYLYPGKA